MKPEEPPRSLCSRFPLSTVNRERRQAGGDVFGVDPLDPLPSGGPPAPVGSGSGGSMANGI